MLGMTALGMTALGLKSERPCLIATIYTSIFIDKFHGTF
jgi:hypothetical protein